MNYILQTNSLTKKYKNFQALNGLTMNVPKGSIYGFVGKNGAGKTTLIRLICGLQEPTSGSFSLYGIRNDSKDIIKSRRRMGAVVETPSIYMDMTAEENLKHQYLILGLPSFDCIQELLKLVGLDNTGEKKAKNFSLGMKQRLGLARLLAGQAELLLMDEPFASLDFLTRAELQSQLLAIQEKLPRTIVLVTHQLEEALLLGRRIIVMHTDSTICEFDLTDSPYPRDLDDPTLRRLKKAITDQCRYTA